MKLFILLSCLFFSACSATDSHRVVLGYGCSSCVNVLDDGIQSDDVICDDSYSKFLSLKEKSCNNSSECLGRCKNSLCVEKAITFECASCVKDLIPSEYYYCMNDE